MAENFDLIFGQSASSQYAWNDSDYQNGWGTVGSTPPIAEQFDALQRRSDKKAQELNNALTPLVNQNTASNRQPVTAYVEKDIRYSTLLPTGWYLECTTAGTSGSGDITLPSPLVENATITDGTVVWTIRKVASTSDIPAPVDISGKANVDLSNLTDAGKSFSFPSDTYVTIVERTTTDTSIQSTSYTATADGFIMMHGKANAASWISCSNSELFRNIANTSIAGQDMAFTQSVRKGDTLTITWYQTTQCKVRFYYAQGEVPN